MTLQRVPIRQAGNRANLFMGGDRELVMSSILLAATLIFATQDWLAAFIGAAMWVGLLSILRKMAKSDPWLRQVYIRSLKYPQAYYPARATPFRSNTSLQGKRYEQGNRKK